MLICVCVITMWWVGGVINTGSGVRISRVSSPAEPVFLVDSVSHIAPAAHVALEVTMSMGRTLSVGQVDIIKCHVSFLGGARLHTFHHDLRHKACDDGNCMLFFKVKGQLRNQNQTEQQGALKAHYTHNDYYSLIERMVSSIYSFWGVFVRTRHSSKEICLCALIHRKRCLIYSWSSSIQYQAWFLHLLFNKHFALAAVQRHTELSKHTNTNFTEVKVKNCFK